MDKFHRISQLHQEFSCRRFPIQISNLAEKFDCSEKTIKRTIDLLQTELNAPLEYIAKSHGWRYMPDKKELFELPGLWMNENELVSLIMLLSILETFGNGLLNEELQRTNDYITMLLDKRGLNRSDIIAKLKILPITQKILPSKTLYQVSEALFKNCQLTINYLDFNSNQTQRNISPQTLVYYRDNWYVDAWCHLRLDLRTFSVARITSVSLLGELAKHVSKEKLDLHFSNSYGIFAGQSKQIAKLKFSPYIAREIAMQSWHGKQSSHWEGEYYVLEIPYDKSDELVMDIMRYLPHVEVLEPESLNQEVSDKIKQAYEIYCR